MFEIRELFRSATDVKDSSKGFCLSSPCVCRRKKVLIVMTFVEVADVATQLWHPHKISFTGSHSLLGLTKLKSVLLHGVVSLFCTNHRHRQPPCQRILSPTIPESCYSWARHLIIHIWSRCEANSDSFDFMLGSLVCVRCESTKLCIPRVKCPIGARKVLEKVATLLRLFYSTRKGQLLGG